MIYFIRHGQTDDNVNGNILSGWSDTPLNKNGILQAKETSENLKNINFDICYCSPLTRAKQTLAEIKKYHSSLNIVYDDRLKERDYGEITKKPASICKFRRWHADDKIPYKMETISEMFERISSFYDDLKAKHLGKNILIVSHSGVGRLTHFYFNGKPSDNDYSNFELGNAKIMKIEF